MRIPVISIPNWRVARGRMVFEAIYHKLDRCCGVRNKDKVEVFWIGVEES